MIRLSEHYARTVEGHRLFRTKANRIEFLSTIHFLKEYLYPEKRMIELGSGHGVYARYFASNGYNILATDIVQSNIDKINELITPDIKEYIQTMQIVETEHVQAVISR